MLLIQILLTDGVRRMDGSVLRGLNGNEQVKITTATGKRIWQKIKKDIALTLVEEL